MEIKIIPRLCGGTEFEAQPHRLHLGGQNAEGVDTLRFTLPPAWQECTVTLYLRRGDGSSTAAVTLSAEGTVVVDRRLTGGTGGQWMVAALNGSGYTAYSRPGSYDTYATLPTDDIAPDPTPSLYQQFVAQVLEHANTAQAGAKRAEDAAQQAQEVIAGAGEVYAVKTHSHTTATQSAAGFLSSYDKKKLDSINWNATAGITASTGASFMRCSNGVQLCWGTAAADAASVRLPAPFANTGYAVSFAGVGAADRYLAPEGKTTSTFTPGGSGAFDYLAIGRWK